MLRDFTPRLYQQTILGTTANFNTLVVLPTGLGKTAIAFLTAAHRLHHYPHGKILLLSPTKPLCEQHVQSFQKHLDLPPEKIVLFTGNIKPEKRAELWKDAQIIISTPQGLENDVINQRVKLEEISLLIFDEAHHATGDYAYVWLAQQYDKMSHYTRILALTASPGSDLEKVKEICQNLKIEKVEVRTEKDPDVKPYVQKTDVNWIHVDFPQEYKTIRTHLQQCRKAKLLEVQNLGCCHHADLSKGEILQLQGLLQQKISHGEQDYAALRSLSLLAEALKVEHALELLESQGIPQLQEYFHKIRQQAETTKVKAVKNLLLDENFKASMHLTDELHDHEHPKMSKLRTMLTENPVAKTIIFTQFRNSAEQIIKQLHTLHLTSHIFVGQAKKNGLGFSQKEQKDILDRFRNGEFSILVATSVAEEGLDIPKVDEVIFYEPVPSAIRAIQRRGRTGRLEKGEVKVLITSGTRDERYRWSAHHKEKRMHRNLNILKKEFTLQPLTKERTLDQFIPTQQVVAIVADHREKDNRTIKELIDLGVAVKTAQLESADYVVSGKVGVELKKIPDFVASIIDGRLLDQLATLKKNFEKAIVIIEGEEDIYAIRKVHANAIRGMLATIALDFHIPILYTKNPRDTAALLAVMAKREQDTGRDYSLHSAKPQTLSEQQEYFVSAIPSLGLITARKLLHHFGTIQAIIHASPKQLQEVEGIGTKTTERMRELFEKKYEKKEK